MPPPCECVNRITGLPILSSSATPAGTASALLLFANCICALAKLSKTGSPSVPFFGLSLGHWVYLFMRGKLPRSRTGPVQIAQLIRAVRMPSLPSTSRHVRRAAARRVIHHIDRVALLQQIVGPSRAAVGRLAPTAPVWPLPWKNHRDTDAAPASAPTLRCTSRSPMISLPGIAYILAAGVKEAVARRCCRSENVGMDWTAASPCLTLVLLRDVLVDPGVQCTSRYRRCSFRASFHGRCPEADLPADNWVFTPA